MNLVRQSPGTKTCGQCSVAMITGVDLQDVVDYFGHIKGTTVKEVAAALNHYGVNVANRLTPLRFGCKLPDFCLCHVSNHDGTGHWCVKEGNFIYCPSVGIYNLKSIQPAVKGRITSYIKLPKND